MSLYHKYRPDTLEEIRGNSEIIEPLQNMLKDLETCSQVFLIHGPTGCGKTTIGRIIGKELNCAGNDFREVNSADFRGVETIREIRKQAQFKPLEGRCRVWLIDECHQMTMVAQSALLKMLEDTPKHVYFVLCTTNPQSLLATIKGRCTQFQVKPLSEHQMMGLLRSVVKAEGEQLQKVVYEQIFQDSFGYPRNALQILEQVLVVEPGQRLEIAKQSAEQLSESIELCRALIRRDNWKKISNILNGLKDQDAEGIRRHVLGYAQSVLLNGKMNDTAGQVLDEFVEPFWNSGFPGLTLACYLVIKD